MEYGNKLRRAWEITWKYKFLWLFGIAMALCRAEGGGNNFNFNRGRGDYNGNMQPLPPQVTQAVEQFLASGMIWVIIGALIVLVLLFAVISVVVVAFTRGALVRSANRLEDNQPLDLGQAWQEGKARFMPLFGLEAVLAVPGLVLGIGMLIMFVYFFMTFIQQGVFGQMEDPQRLLQALTQTMPIFLVGICGLVCLSVLYRIGAAILSTFGSRAIALEDKGVLAGMARGWKVFVENLAASIIVALILFAISLGLGFLLALPIAAIIGGLVVFMFATMRAMEEMWFVFVLLIGVVVMIVAVLASLVRGVYYVFAETLWTLSYREFVGLAGAGAQEAEVLGRIQPSETA